MIASCSLVTNNEIDCIHASKRRGRCTATVTRPRVARGERVSRLAQVPAPFVVLMSFEAITRPHRRRSMPVVSCPQTHHRFLLMETVYCEDSSDYIMSPLAVGPPHRLCQFLVVEYFHVDCPGVQIVPFPSSSSSPSPTLAHPNICLRQVCSASYFSHEK
jgi:hypothetical protein